MPMVHIFGGCYYIYPPIWTTSVEFRKCKTLWIFLVSYNMKKKNILYIYIYIYIYFLKKKYIYIRLVGQMTHDFTLFLVVTKTTANTKKKTKKRYYVLPKNGWTGLVGQAPHHGHLLDNCHVSWAVRDLFDLWECGTVLFLLETCSIIYTSLWWDMGSWSMV